MFSKNTYPKKLAVLLTVLLFLPYVLNATHALVHNFHLNDNITQTGDDNSLTECHWSDLQLTPALLVTPSSFTTVAFTDFAPVKTITPVFLGDIYTSFFSLRAPPQQV